MQAAMSGSSRILSAIAALMLVCLLREASTQENSVVVSLHPNNINVFRGDSIWLYCYCISSTLPPVSSMKWLRNGTEVKIQSSCSTFVHHLQNIDFEDQAEYACQVELENGTVIGPIIAGGMPLNVVDPTRIQAEPQQYGLLHSNTSLSCNTTFDVDPAFIFISWERNCTPTSNQITDVRLTHEGQYVCEVFLGHLNGLRMKRNVTFYVIAPPTIISQSPAFHEIRDNRPFSLTVEFQSRFRENTTVAWYRDGSRLPEQHVQTEYRSELAGQTTLSFAPISRSDGGVYRVVIENSFEIIPQLLRTNETWFNVSVIVPPSTPSNVRALNVTRNQAQITWSLNTRHPDEEAETLTLMLEFVNGTLVEQYSLAGDVTQQRVNTIPGMEYRVTLTASNQDGTRTADPVLFQTPAGVPSPPSLIVTRVRNTTFNLSVSLAYTGGGDITHLIVYFSNGTAWTSLGQIPASPSPESSLVWSAVVSRDEFAGMTVQFEVHAVNRMLFQSPAVVVQEPVFLSGAPTTSLISTSSCSVTVEVQLSSDGTPPIQAILFNFTSPPGYPTQRLNGPFFPGDIIKGTLSGLVGSTEYRLTAAAINSAGTGPSSDEIIFKTDIAIWVFVLIAVACIIMIVAISVVAMVTRHCCKVHRRKKEYYINPATSADEKQLDPTHEM